MNRQFTKTAGNDGFLHIIEVNSYRPFRDLTLCGQSGLIKIPFKTQNMGDCPTCYAAWQEALYVEAVAERLMGEYE